jgi:xanthine dehydrogenase accessory factor
MTTTADIAERASELAGRGRAAAVGRVVDIQGFSTWPGDELVLVEADGSQIGGVLGEPGRAAVQAAARELLAGTDRLVTTTIAVHGTAVAELGLSCGGQAEVLLQPLRSVPGQLWAALAARSPVALLTRLANDAGAQPPRSAVLTADGRSWGDVGGDRDELLAEAERMLRGGHGGSVRRTDTEGTVLIEAWVPTPRLVIVGAGDLVSALDRQAGLLGWETRSVNSPGDFGAGDVGAGDVGAGDFGAALDWAGESVAVVVLSHDPHVDTPAIKAALERGSAYVGAMGSRNTQSKRLERLAAAGVAPAELDRIHRPIGLDLGGRSAQEVALSICAEILADHCGRDARPLAERDGPINARPSSTA